MLSIQFQNIWNSSYLDILLKHKTTNPGWCNASSSISARSFSHSRPMSLCLHIYLELGNRKSLYMRAEKKFRWANLRPVGALCPSPTTIAPDQGAIISFCLVIILVFTSVGPEGCVSLLLGTGGLLSINTMWSVSDLLGLLYLLFLLI
jgi:hypothetical protein